MMSAVANQTVFSTSPSRNRRKYFSWEMSKDSSSWSPRRRSCSLPADEGPTSGGPQFAVVFDVVASSSVGRLLRRRFTEVCRRSRRVYRPQRLDGRMDGSPTASSAFLRPALSSAAAGSADYGSRQQQYTVLSSDHLPPPATVSAVTQSTWSWTAMRPTSRLTTETVGGRSVTTATFARTGNTATSTSGLRDQFTSFFQVSDNKLAMKLFGNKNALEKEKLRHEAVGHWVIHPCSDFRSSIMRFTCTRPYTSTGPDKIRFDQIEMPTY